MRRLHQCDVHGRFMFDMERLEAQAGTRIASCPRCFIARMNTLVPRDPPKPRTTCWYVEGEAIA